MNSDDLIELGRNSQSLVITDRLFKPEILESLSLEERQDIEKTFRSYFMSFHHSPSYSLNNKWMYKLNHRFYFSFPMFLPEKPVLSEKDKEIPPGYDWDCRRNFAPNHFVNTLYDIKPQFTELEPNFFYEKFKTLDNAIMDIMDKPDPISLDDYDPYGFWRSEIETMDSRSGKYERTSVFQKLVTRRCGQILRLLQKNYVTYHNEKPLKYEDSVFFASLTAACKPPSQKEYIESTNCLLFVEVVCPTLDSFIKDGNLVEDDANLNMIMKKMCSMLYRMGVTCFLLTDFHITICFKLQFTVQDQRASRRQSHNLSGSDPVKIPMGYRIIRNTDCGITLQAVFASLVYDEIKFQQTGIDKSGKGGLLSRSEQVEQLKMITTKSKHDLYEVEQEYVVAAKNRLLNCIKNPPEYWEYWPTSKQVNTNKFDRHVTIDMKSKSELVPIRAESDYKAQVYLFPYSQYSECFKGRIEGSVPDTVVLKLYDFNELENYTRLWFKDLCCMARDDEFNYDDMFEYATNLILREVGCYERIQSSGSAVRVPKLYDYGIMTWCVNGTPKSSGYYLLVTYIETTETDQQLLECVKKGREPYDEITLEDLEKHEELTGINKDLKHQISLLDQIGVSQGDTVLRNLVLKDGKFTIIDFSSGVVFDPKKS